jgi:low temperature requirement protein LtrA
MDAQRTEREQRVTPLELFFDLVVVFAFTQVTELMSDDLTWRGSVAACSCSPRSGGRGRAMPG